MKMRVLVWDWREQPDIGDINNAIWEVFDGTHAPSLTEVPTEGDYVAVVVSGGEVTLEEAQAYVNSVLRDPNEKDEDP